MTIACLGLGSNIEPERHIGSGIAALRDRFANVRLSPVYRSAAVGFTGADFLNLVVSIETCCQPLELKHWLQDLELLHGRRRDMPRFSDRTLDIDILLYGDLWLVSPALEIPRGEIRAQAHVLRPLAELVPDWVHPSDGRTIAGIWQAFPQHTTRLKPVPAAF